MAPTPRRLTLLRGMVGTDERLRHSLITAAARAPTEQEPDHIIGDPGEPVFQNDWGAAPGFGPPRFWKTSSGWIHLAGVAKWTYDGFATLNQPMFNLPTSYRPPFEQLRADLLIPFDPASSFATASQPQISLLTIEAENRTGEGNVASSQPASTANRCVSLDGLVFRNI